MSIAMPALKQAADDGFKTWFIEIVSGFEQLFFQNRTGGRIFNRFKIFLHQKISYYLIIFSTHFFVSFTSKDITSFLPALKE